MNLLQVSVNLVNMYVGILVGTCTKKYLDSVEKKSSLILFKTYNIIQYYKWPWKFFLWTNSITYLVPLVLNALCQGKVGEVGRGQPAASSGAHNKWNNHQIYRQSRPQLRSHPRLQAHPKSCFKAQERKSVMPNIVYMSSFCYYTNTMWL